MVRADFDVHPYERFFYRLCAVFLLLFTINTIIIMAIRLVAKISGKNILKFNLHYCPKKISNIRFNSLIINNLQWINFYSIWIEISFGDIIYKETHYWISRTYEFCWTVFWGFPNFIGQQWYLIWDWTKPSRIIEPIDLFVFWWQFLFSSSNSVRVSVTFR